jgi:hypothetical protein
MVKHMFVTGIVTKKCLSCIGSIIVLGLSSYCQVPDSIPTGYLPDAAEEYWPFQTDSQKLTSFTERIKHLPVNKNKGFNTIGINIRETYELFDNYFWGMGTQDNDGYLLHRLLVHDDLRWNKYVRLFAEVQSSMISGRNGGPRPVQDRNDLSINQAFGQVTLPMNKRSILHVRIGKQYLNYGAGTLLDARDANVRRSFWGYKLILESRSLRLDAFFMELAATKTGILDDIIDRSQKVAGIWAAKKISIRGLTKIDLYYIFIKRTPTKFNQGVGDEQRHTIGSGIYYNSGNWSGYSEADFQWGRFNEGAIIAWKVAPSIAYQCKSLLFKPVFTLQGAVSSGDRDASGQELQTFNPLYPKAIFYGFIDNAGSANLIVVHPKLELQFTGQLRLAVGYFKFWRRRAGDGLYAVNGAYLLAGSAGSRNVGAMIDLAATWSVSKHCALQAFGSFYQRDQFLRQQPVTKGDIRYLGIKTSVRL